MVARGVGRPIDATRVLRIRVGGHDYLRRRRRLEADKWRRKRAGRIEKLETGASRMVIYRLGERACKADEYSCTGRRCDRCRQTVGYM
jgi:hypothetical protein